MGFQTQVNARMAISGTSYAIGEHPYAPGMPYGQEGRQGTVYLLHDAQTNHKKAMKVFRSKFVNPSMVHSTRQIVQFAGMTGLAACDRFLITPQNNAELLAVEPDLLYAVVMPWIEGPTWLDILLNQRRLTRRQSYTAAFALAEILVTMEQRGLAHCDLSGPNVMLPLLREDKANVKSSNFVQLIDLEQMFAAQMERPDPAPGGSPGYAPRRKKADGLWSGQADRFAGAVLFVEMLGACSDAFVSSAWGESYFDPNELQTLCERYDTMRQIIRSTWGENVASLLVRAWESDDLGHCPTFGEWMVELSKVDPSALKEPAGQALKPPSAPGPSAESGPKREAAPERAKGAASAKGVADVGALLKQAKALEQHGKYKKALELYRSIRAQNPHAGIAREVEIAIGHAEEQQRSAVKLNFALIARMFLKQFTKIAVVLVILGALGTGGYYAFSYVKGWIEHGPAPTKAEVRQTNAEIKRLEDEISQKNAAIAGLEKQIESLKKPLSQRQQDLVYQLDDDYEKVQKWAGPDSGEIADPDRKTFEAAEAYMGHLFQYLQLSGGLDRRLMEQTKVIQGYYFPYLYNRERNAQLNLQFFKAYQDKFSLQPTE